jgi:pimeloyl-ACP methyl ester carboxylesterase
MAMRGIEDALLDEGSVRVCDYDRAGEGRSDPPAEPQDDLDVVDDHAALLVAADIEPPYVLVGHSLGGDQAWLYADRHPEGVAGFMLMNAGFFELAPVPGAASAGELIQQALPRARVVSAFKNLSAEKLRDYDFSLKGFTKHLWIYAVMFCLVLPAVLVASRTHSFRQTYPFYRIANRSHADLAMWEALYVVQFLALEFFFRGFILQGLRRALGANAIFVMLVPYCMIHYGKPLPETLGAIGAGLILGTLAMRTRSIWGGVLIHVGVAITMDVLALRGCPPLGGRPCH